MKRTSIIKCTRAISALICLWWPMVAVSAFASHHTTSTSSNININPSTLQTSVLRSSRANNNKYKSNQIHKQSATKLHLTIPRGGAAAAASASTGILSDLSSKLSTLTSTPTGTFNTALVILGAATAVLKIYNKVDATTSDDGEKKEVQKKDPKVKSLQMRFLAVFWLLRMADWLQVSLHTCN